MNKTYIKINQCSFSTPFLYDKFATTNLESSAWINIEESFPYLHSQRENLKLFIKIPKNSRSAITILEGDYLNSSNHYFNTLYKPNSTGELTAVPTRELKLMKYITGRPYIKDGDEYRAQTTKEFNPDYNTKYISRVSLGYIDSGINHPFADRLIEYLISNSITPTDTIDNNIARVQHNLLVNGAHEIGLKKIGIEGYWTKSIRNILFRKAVNANIVDSIPDILGYVDKDIERYINLEDGE